MEKQAELFQPFSRLGFENSEIEGTGIGLSITKRLIERMDGAIGCESEIDKGSTFWLELPGEAVDAAKPADTFEPKHEKTNGNTDENTGAQSETSSAASKIILYIEDNPANLSLMEMIISRTDGIDMISAFNAEIGLDLVRSKKPDLILLDINLPGMNGFEALKAIKGMEESAETPIIAISAAASKHDVETAMDAGFDAYLTKPINVQELLKALKSNLGIE